VDGVDQRDEQTLDGRIEDVLEDVVELGVDLGPERDRLRVPDRDDGADSWRRERGRRGGDLVYVTTGSVT
jgi:hypothetical protein